MNIIPVEKLSTVIPTEAATTLPPTTQAPTTQAPTTQPPTTLPPTTLPPLNCNFTNSLIVESDNDCERLLENGWKSITVNEGLCNSMTNNLVISDNPCLESLVFKKNSLKNLNRLVISNNSELKSMEIEDGQGYGYFEDTYYAPFENVKSVEISSIF